MHLQESGEMYLETIYILLKKTNDVRSMDIAEYMNGTEVYISGGKFCTQNPQYGWEHMV